MTRCWPQVGCFFAAMTLSQAALAVSSAELYTAASYPYGRFEARARLAAGDGVPAARDEGAARNGRAQDRRHAGQSTKGGAGKILRPWDRIDQAHRVGMARRRQHRLHRAVFHHPPCIHDGKT